MDVSNALRVLREADVDTTVRKTQEETGYALSRALEFGFLGTIVI